MKEVRFTDVMGEITERLKNGGIFLTAPGNPPNTMTIAWATMGFCWNRPVFVCLVRPQRHSYPLIEESGEFSVSIPTKNPLKKELAFAGTKSGRDLDKFSGHGMTAAPAQAISAPIVAECGLHLECRVMLRQAMTGEHMNQTIIGSAYPEGDYHIMFYGEIVKCYTTDE